MKGMYKILALLLVALTIMITLFSAVNTQKLECDNQTLIISVCTGEMRALETGVSVYAGYTNTPLILSDKTLPEQLSAWLPGYVEENNITKIIIVGPVKFQQIIEYMKLGVTVKHVDGNSIADILTKLAEHDENISTDEIIITASDPLAGVLGAYTRTPVFITASNSTYQSSDTLQKEYVEYMEKNHVQKVIIVGNLPESVKDKLRYENVTIEEISGQTSLEVSTNLNNKLKNEGYTDNTTKAFYGFYGELPTIVPTVIRENAILIEDSSNTGNIVPYLNENNISTVYILRNTQTQYIQMEETDYISQDVINNLEENNITINYLTKQRTLDEATGLYDMKIMTAEYMQNITLNETIPYSSDNMQTQPPLIAILNTTECIDSNSIGVHINKSEDTYNVKWDTIHPYTWKKTGDSTYYATSNTGYEYFWTKSSNNTWQVRYVYNNTTYYNITWTQNPDNTWTEIHEKNEYIWKYDASTWTCFNNKNQPIYYIKIIRQ